MSEAIAFEPGLWDVDAETYHADMTTDSSSSLEMFRDSIPLYHAVRIAKTLERPGPTPAMLLGSAVHCMLLESQHFGAMFAIAPEINRRTNAGKEDWQRFQQAAEGKAVLTPEQSAVAYEISIAVQNNRMAADLLAAPGRSEQSIRWLDEETGVALKARFDRLLDCKIFLDVKTTSDPTPNGWARSVVNYGIHRQAALYIDGFRAAVDPDGWQCLHVVVGTSPPFDAHVFELDQAALELGRKQNRETLARLQQCRIANCWASQWADQISTISLPRYAFYGD